MSKLRLNFKKFSPPSACFYAAILKNPRSAPEKVQACSQKFENLQREKINRLKTTE
jgi:hypothetical protein